MNPMNSMDPVCAYSKLRTDSLWVPRILEELRGPSPSASQPGPNSTSARLDLDLAALASCGLEIDTPCADATWAQKAFLTRNETTMLRPRVLQTACTALRNSERPAVHSQLVLTLQCSVAGLASLKNFQQCPALQLIAQQLGQQRLACGRWLQSSLLSVLATSTGLGVTPAWQVSGHVCRLETVEQPFAMQKKAPKLTLACGCNRKLYAHDETTDRFVPP